jgi:hypothetical protein
MKKKRFFFLFVLLVFVALLELQAQSTSINTSTGMASTQFDMSGFPLWAKNLRRGEIIAFGAFPIMYFFSNFGFDTYRWVNNGNDMRYAPWPFNSAGTVGKTTDEKLMTLGIAAGSAVLIALIDYGIVRYKRNLLEREQANLPDGNPVVIRRPLVEKEEEADSDAEALAETE